MDFEPEASTTIIVEVAAHDHTNDDEAKATESS